MNTFQNFFTSLFYFIYFMHQIKQNNCQIHRATSQNSYHIKYDNNFTLQYYLNKLVSFDQESLVNYKTNDFVIWLVSILGTFFVGISGVLPVLILPKLADDNQTLLKSSIFKCLISFAGGSLLGDVFLHLLPETYSNSVIENDQFKINAGLWSILGIFIFFSIEKLFPDDDDEKEVNDDKKNKVIGAKHQNGSIKDHNNNKIESIPKRLFFHSIKTIGLLNLFANVIDNFTHGIAVSGGFQASLKFGVMSLIATLLHEIPHEIGDFVILLKSGLNYKQAAMAQLFTAFSGILGAMFALCASSAENAGNRTAWILPFTSGGFIYISMSNIITELIEETDLKSSIKQIMCLAFGIFIIYLFSSL